MSSWLGSRVSGSHCAVSESSLLHIHATQRVADDTVRGSISISIKVELKSEFHLNTLNAGHNSRNCGTESTRQNYIT